MATASTKQAWARGGTIFAATLLLLIGVFQFFVGIAAIVQDNFFVVGANYTYEIDTTTWGWIHLVIGVVAAATGFFLFTGATWARWLAIAMAAISAVANFFFLPYYPLWSLLIIALDIFAIWAIANGRGRNEHEPAGSAAMSGTGTPAMAGHGLGTGSGQPGSGSDAMQSGQRWPDNQGQTQGMPNPAMQGQGMQGQGMQGQGMQGQGDAAQSGRHWAPDNVKTPDNASQAQSMGDQAQPAAQQAAEEAQRRTQR